jgi:hypothetical protein
MDTIEHNPHNLPGRSHEWTPVQDGDVYCSPACGGRCKKAAYDYAVKAANELVTMLGNGWQPQVWENLGWHFRASKGESTVSFDGTGFSAALRPYQQALFSGEGNTPRQAVENALIQMKRERDQLDRAIASFQLDPLELPN